MSDEAWTAVDFAWCVIGAGFTAVSVWLTVRIVNRRERWAKWTLALVIAAPVLYGASWGPVIWVHDRELLPRSATPILDVIYWPLINIATEPESDVGLWLRAYAELWMPS